MVNKRFPTLFFFLLIALSLFVFLPSTIEPVYATDYDVFEIANAYTKLANTYVWDNFLYVENNSYLLKYDLATKTLDDQINLGASTEVNDMVGRGDFLYLNVTEIATPKVVAIDLIQFIEADRIACSLLTNWNYDTKNLAYLLDDGTDYWAWTEVTGANVLVPDNYAMTLLGYSLPSPQYPRFIGMVFCYQGTTVTDVYIWGHLWNGTGVESDSDLIVVPQHSSVTGFCSWTLTPSLATFGQYQHPVGSWHRFGYNINAFTDTQGRFEDSGDNLAVYASYDSAGIHSPVDSRWNFVMNSTATNKYYYDYDTPEHHIRIQSDVKNRIWFSSFWSDDSYPYNSYYSSAIGTTLSRDGDFDNPRPKGIIAGIETLDNFGFEGLFLAYVQDQNQTPIAYRTYGMTNIEVGVLPVEYDPIDCILWANKVGQSDDYQDDGIVALWIENADTTLYVCVNLIEAEFMRYGETDNVQAQVYKSYATGTVDNFRLETRWMVDVTNYPRLSGQEVYVYLDGVYLHTLTTNGYGITQAIYAFNPANYPETVSCYMNKTGYNDQWLNVTYYSYSSQSADSTITEEPVLALEFDDNRESENMRVKLDIMRYTGEQFGDDWFLDVLNVHVYVETYAGDALDDVIDVGVLESDINGEIEFILSYTEPYSYIVKHYYDVTEQNICIGNFTENSQVQFAYDSSTGNVTEGEYVTLPDVPTTTEFYPTGDESINPTTLEGFAVIWSGNTGFLIALGFITAITVGFAKVSPESAVFGVITLVGITIGFLGYTGLLPFPIFVVTLLVIVLGITVIFTNMLTGGKGKSE